MKSIEDLEQENFESREETLNVLFDRVISITRRLDGYSAIKYTNPLVGVLIKIVRQLESHE